MITNGSPFFHWEQRNQVGERVGVRFMSVEEKSQGGRKEDTSLWPA